MLMLCSELVNESSPSHVRNAAGLALKNAVSARVSRLVCFCTAPVSHSNPGNNAATRLFRSMARSRQWRTKQDQRTRTASSFFIERESRPGRCSVCGGGRGCRASSWPVVRSHRYPSGLHARPKQLITARSNTAGYRLHLRINSTDLGLRL